MNIKSKVIKYAKRGWRFERQKGYVAIVVYYYVPQKLVIFRLLSKELCGEVNNEN